MSKGANGREGLHVSNQSGRKALVEDLLGLIKVHIWHIQLNRFNRVL